MRRVDIFDVCVFVAPIAVKKLFFDYAHGRRYPPFGVISSLPSRVVCWDRTGALEWK